MVRVQFFSLLRLLLQRETLELPAREGETVGRLLARVEAAVGPPVTGKLLDGAGALQTGTIILVNRRNIHHLNGLATEVRDGDVLALFPPGAGG